MYLNLCHMHRTVSERLGPRVAMRYRENGCYRDLSWDDYRSAADRGGLGLIQLGIKPGDRVAILSENRYEWLLADHAMLSVGASTVPLHAPLAPQQVRYQVSHSEARGIFVSGQDQADKVLEVLSDLPDLEFIVSFCPIVIDAPLRTLTWEALKQTGADADADIRAELRAREAAITGDDLATIIYTSGTTGNPKGVMLTHDNLLSNTAASAEGSDFGADDVLLSWLPYSHIYARTIDHYVTTHAMATLCLAESVETLVRDLATIKPTRLTAVPRVYEKIWSLVEPLEPEARRQQLRGIFGPRMDHLSSGAAPLPRHVCEGFWDAGLSLYEGYGLTESSPVISFNNANASRIGSVGQPLPGVEVRIADDGEILTRGPHVMPGYWRNPEATAATIVDGWLHTGDVGVVDDDGFLSITDRKKDLIITSGGKNIAPSELERLLVSDPLIDQAITYGDGRQFVTALIIPNLAELQAVARDSGWSMDVDGDFIVCEHTHKYVAARVDDVMQAVSHIERVKRFLLLARPLSIEHEELTATLKVRRRHIIAKYEAELTGLYTS